MFIKKRLGQNFLIDKNIQSKIIKYCNLQETEIVLEIGPGRGELTHLLLERVHRLLAVEIDQELCKILGEKFTAYDNFELINADILKLDLSKLVLSEAKKQPDTKGHSRSEGVSSRVDTSGVLKASGNQKTEKPKNQKTEKHSRSEEVSSRADTSTTLSASTSGVKKDSRNQMMEDAVRFSPSSKQRAASSENGLVRLKVVANLPYYISTPAISHLLKYRKNLETVYLTLQKELAQRLVAQPATKDYSAFSCLAQFYSQSKILFSIRNSCFWPKPKVDSCFVELKILPEPKVKVQNEALFFKLIRLAFNQRRKFIKNSLAGMFSEAELLDCFEAVGLKQTLRAEDLSLSDFARVADYFSRTKRT